MTELKHRKQRTDTELHVTSNRLFYEWRMLTHLAEALKGSDNNQLLKNTFIESSAIHARTLVKFLFAYQLKRGPLPIDAIADDFFTTPDEWRNAMPSLPKELEYDAFQIFADKQIAHISYTDDKGSHPINQGHHDWDVAALADAIQPALERFISIVSKDKLGDYWSNQLERQSGPRWNRLKQLVMGMNA